MRIPWPLVEEVDDGPLPIRSHTAWGWRTSPIPRTRLKIGEEKMVSPMESGPRISNTKHPTFTPQWHLRL